MMRKVYVCAPLGGDVESNLKRSGHIPNTH